MKTQYYILGLILLMLVASCKKDSENKPIDATPGFLFKATFESDWLSPKSAEAIIFICDDDGNVLSEHIWEGNDSFEMLPTDENADYPDTINITTVYYKHDQNQFIITTNLGIAVGSEWTFKGVKSADEENGNKVDFNFQNAPDHKGYVMSSKWSTRTNTNSMGQPFSFNFYESPAEIFLKLNTVEYGIRYKWFHNVVDGGRNEDLSVSGMKEASLHTVNFASNSFGIRTSLYGYPETGHHYEGAYRVDVLNDLVNTYKSITLSYPAADFTDYRCTINFYDDFSSLYFWTQISYGAIPTDFNKMNADFDVVSTSMNNFELAAVGDYIQTKSVWGDEKNNIWTVQGGKSFTKYKIPVLSPMVVEKFKIDRALFKFQQAELIDYPELDNYLDVLDIMYNSPYHLFNKVNMYRSRTKLSSNQDSK
ncbi:MAG: hypothetical protein K9H64_05400 [Bacteroidales bacterium]|nr:hypothetical protein [Bacteroidales bacterium]MCF8455275.1 hypothetical protein [Bacteroidales bacterium]